MIQGAYSLLDGEQDWVWRNAVIAVYGDNIDINFHSGDASNKFVVHLNEYDQVSSACTGKGLRLRLRDGVKSVWNFIKRGAQAVVGAIAGVGYKMLQY